MFSTLSFGLRQRRSRADQTLTEERLYELLKASGVQIADWMLEAARQRDLDYSETYRLSDLPNRWPLLRIKELLPALQKHVCTDGRHLSHDSILVGLIRDDEFNAVAWPDDIAVALNRGLWNQFFIYSFAAVVPITLSYDDGLPPPVVSIVKDLQRSACKMLFAADPDAHNRAFVALLEARSRLRDDYATYRAAIETVPTLIVDTCVCFIFLHEYSHLLLCHGLPGRNVDHSIVNELAADWEAADLITQMFAVHSGIISYFPALAFSYLEARERIANHGVLRTVDRNSSHPPPDARRWQVLKSIQWSIRFMYDGREGPSVQMDPAQMDAVRNFAHIIHVSLSAILVANGLTPLSSFFSREWVQLSGATMQRAGLEDWARQLGGVPARVIDSELQAFAET